MQGIGEEFSIIIGINKCTGMRKPGFIDPNTFIVLEQFQHFPKTFFSFVVFFFRNQYRLTKKIIYLYRN